MPHCGAATVPQYAHDVSTFLMWAAEPHMEERKRLGLQVFVFLIIMSLLLYLTKKKVWARCKNFCQINLRRGGLRGPTRTGAAPDQRGSK